MIANVEFAGDITGINPNKFEQALNFISKIQSDKISLISIKLRDSLILANQENNIHLDIFSISKNLNANYILFAKTNAFKHLIRTDIILVNANDSTKLLKGFGYASANFVNDSGTIVYDPAILHSLQRAIAVAVGDSAIFVDSANGMHISPAPLLAVGGLYFADDEKLQRWFLFDKKVVNSYDAVETIFGTAIKNQDFVTIDIETRDSIFLINNLFMIENYSAPSEHELLALYKMGIEFYISGILERTAVGAKAELFLYKFENGALQSIASAHEILTEDSIYLLRESLKFITNKILNYKQAYK